MVNRSSWFGIDFGTTNSAAFSFTGADMSTIMPISYGDDEGRPFPSVVAIHKKTGEIVVGRYAKEHCNELRTEDYIYFTSIKSIIDSVDTWEIANECWCAEDIAAEIFRALKERMERNSENCVENAVVAVPVGYSEIKRMHLRKAANKAGINVDLFISEPTAAFCSNYPQLKECRNVAVFDWGGGTLDIVILNIHDGKVEELSSEGMSVAGNDIDNKIAEKIHSKFMRNIQPKISYDELDPITKDLLLLKCEKAKCDFSDDDLVTISMNRYGENNSLRETLNYDFFSLLLEKEINDAINCMEKAIKKANMNIVNIDKILCVGGSSKLRPLQEKLAEKYGEDKIYYPEKVMWDIAKGAAIIATRPGCYELNKSIGLILSDGTFFPLFKRGQQIPCEEFNMNFGTVDGSSDNNNQARFVFTDAENDEDRSFTEYFSIPIRGFCYEKIQLSCYIDADFIFKLKVGTNFTHEQTYRVWSYNKLKVCYKIDGE